MQRLGKIKVFGRALNTGNVSGVRLQVSGVRRERVSGVRGEKAVTMKNYNEEDTIAG
jgi:hypothetical protein